MMTFVVAAVDDRTDEPLRHGDGSGVAVCALRAAGFFGGAMAPSAGAEPYGSTAGTGAPSAIPAMGCYVEARARDAAYEFPSDEFSSAAFAAVGPLDVAGHPTLKLPTPG